VTAFLAAGLAAQGPAGTARVSGVVVDRDRRPVAGARVAFHYATTLGVPWLRSSAETIAVTATVAERDGRFALLVPVGIAGTCIAEGEQGVAVAARAVAGDALRMQLAPARARRFKLLGEVPPGPWQLVFEGPSPLAPRAARSVDGTLHADLVPGFGAVLALPDGFARMPGGAPWFGVSGADVDWLRLAACAPSGPAVAWAAVREAPCVRVADGRRGGASGVVWFGQLVGGEPFAARDAEPCLAPAGERRSLSARADEVVLVASVCAALDDGEEVAFVAADRLAGEADRWHVPGWAGADAPALVLARTGDEWRLLDGGGAPLGLLRGRLTDEDGAPAARAAVRVRPLRCRPADAWKAFPGLEVVADERGGFALPVRLPAGEYEWAAAAPDGRTAGGTLRLDAAGGEAALVLPRGARLTGFVLDADGEPAPGVALELRAGRDDRALSFGWAEHRTFTDARGEFAFGGLAQDALYELVCASAAWGDLVVSGLRPGEEPLCVQLRAPASPR